MFSLLKGKSEPQKNNNGQSTGHNAAMNNLAAEKSVWKKAVSAVKPGKMEMSSNEKGKASEESSENRAMMNSAGPSAGPSAGTSRTNLSGHDERTPAQKSKLELRGRAMSQLIQRGQVRESFSGGTEGDEGVVVKCYGGCFTCCPDNLQYNMAGGQAFFNAVASFNVKAAMTVRTPVIFAFLHEFEVGDNISIGGGRSIQVLANFAALANCQRHHYAAFIKEQDLLVVWDDEGDHLLARAQNIEASLVKYMWNNGEARSKSNNATGSKEKQISNEEHDVEATMGKRPTLLANPIISGCTLALLVVTLSLGWRLLAYEITVDGKYLRLVLLIFVPAQFWLSLFFMATLIHNILQICGRTTYMKENSKFYSAKPPRRLRCVPGNLPHVTIQMPVYKEGLENVIIPTVTSLKVAIATYEQQGGTANIFINDDGLQLIGPAQEAARKEYYLEQGIGYVARPAHDPKGERGEPFTRKGKFKKASNMNYGLMISNKVEEKLLHVKRGREWNQDNEQAAYIKALADVLEDEPRAWADGNIRVGDYILLVDSDTRIPGDCLLDAASEMEQDQEVGIIQYSSGVLLVTDSSFEKGVKFFTELIYSAIQFCVANGDLSPFVGHNAILRWAAVQEVSYKDEDGYEKFWSESHVSEDFDMSLRLQCNRYTIRLGTYFGEGFKEGVSLTVYDELNRWEKYAYGCNELMFNPLWDWPTKGPITPLFMKWFFSPIRLTAKIGIMGYIGTYYAIGAAWVLTLANYFLIGWLGGHLDKYYLNSFKVVLSLLVVFTAGGNVALAVWRYRTGTAPLLESIRKNLTWLPLLTIYLGGISLHVSQALLSHFLRIDMTWGATAKELEENEDLFKGLGRLLRRFKWTFLFCFSSIALMVVMARPGIIKNYISPDWEIREFIAWFPLATIVAGHMLLPIVLNPALMRMHY